MIELEHLRLRVGEFALQDVSLHLDNGEYFVLLGPTGCGKTFLVELLFNEILELPTAHVDVTTFSETGYVGNDVSTILTRLLYAAGGDVLVSQLGVICIDEFDKLSSGSNRAVFSGAGTTKDVTGLGVQRELLKLLERGEFPVPTTFEHSTFQQRLLMRTDDIVFIACGTFISSLTENQIVAFILTFLVAVVLFLIGIDVVLTAVPGWAVPFLKSLSLGSHFSSIQRGVIDSRDIVYYLSVSGFFLFLNVRSVEDRKGR